MRPAIAGRGACCYHLRSPSRPDPRRRGFISVPEPSPATPADRVVQGPRIGFTNGLRGLSILAVIYHHMFAERTPAGTGAIRVGGLTLLPYAPLANGFLGVNLFFILSGFVLYLPYASGRRTMARGEDYRRFYVHRFQRIMPLYYLFVAVALVTVAPPSAIVDHGSTCS